MKVAPAFTNFGKGILSPQLRGRVDIQQYYNSAEELKNCIVRPYGNLVNRAGTRFSMEASSQTLPVRLISFVFNKDESYVVEIGPYYFKFYDTQGNIVKTRKADPADYSSTTGYNCSFYKNALGSYYFEAPGYTFDAGWDPATTVIGKYIRFRDEHGIVIYQALINITSVVYYLREEYDRLSLLDAGHPNNMPAVGSATGGNWAVFNSTYDDDAEEIINVPHPYSAEEIWELDFAQKDDVMFIVHKNHAPRKLYRTGTGPARSFQFAEFQPQAGPFQTINWNTEYIVTFTQKDAGEEGQMTMTRKVNDVTSNVNGFFTADMIGAYFLIDKPDVKNGDDRQGFVQITSIPTTASGASANYIVKRTLDTDNPTDVWALPAWCDRYGYPGSVTMFESRLVFGRTNHEPSALWMSKSFVYDEFCTTDENADTEDNAINLELNTEQANELLALSSGKNLTAITGGGSFIVSSGGNGALTNSNATASRQSSWGCEKIRPVKIGTYSYYVQRGGRKLRESYYLWDEDNYKAVDVTKYAENVTLSGIRDMAYQSNPDSLLWCVRNDGKICVLARSEEEELMAWTVIETDGFYESVTVIPSVSGESDMVWVSVRRTINGEDKRFIEYFDSHVVEEDTNQEDCFYVDCGVTRDGFNTTLEQNLRIEVSFSADNYAEVNVVTSSTLATSFIGRRIVGRSQTGEIDFRVRVTGISASDDSVLEGVTEYVSDSVSTAYSPGSWAWSVDSVTISHLKNTEVSMLVDGGVVPNRTTDASGVVTLPSYGFIINVGLPYESLIVSNPIEAGGRNGTSQGKKQKVSEVSTRVYRTLGLKAGVKGHPLRPIKFRSVASQLDKAEDLFTGDIPNLPVNGPWEDGTQLVYKQDEPLPMNILGVYPKITTEDKI